MLCAPSHLSASTAARAIRASGSHRLCTHLIGACLTASVNSAVRALHLTRVHRPAGCERADNLPYASRCPAPTRITREGHGARRIPQGTKTHTPVPRGNAGETTRVTPTSTGQRPESRPGQNISNPWRLQVRHSREASDVLGQAAPVLNAASRVGVGRSVTRCTNLPIAEGADGMWDRTIVSCGNKSDSCELSCVYMTESTKNCSA